MTNPDKHPQKINLKEIDTSTFYVKEFGTALWNCFNNATKVFFVAGIIFLSINLLPDSSGQNLIQEILVWIMLISGVLLMRKDRSSEGKYFRRIFDGVIFFLVIAALFFNITSLILFQQ